MASDEALRDRSGIPLRGLNDDEVREFLAHPWTCRLATVQPNGAPYVVPLWYEYDHDEGCLYIVARERSAYVEHIKHEPRVAVSIADDSAGNRRVQFEGHAEIVEGTNDRGPVGADGPSDGRALLGRRGRSAVSRPDARPTTLLDPHPAVQDALLAGRRVASPLSLGVLLPVAVPPMVPPLGRGTWIAAQAAMTGVGCFSCQ